MSRDLRAFLRLLEERYPDELVRVGREVDPANFDVTAILQHLENRNRYPLLLFERPRNLLGEAAPFPLISNVYATREHCAIALGMDPANAMLGLSLEYGRGAARRRVRPAHPADCAPPRDGPRPLHRHGRVDARSRERRLQPGLPAHDVQ